MTGQGHAFVLGSGIAGLSTAEILSRNGWRVTLFDTRRELGGDASRATQNWLHTGWLYAALARPSAMLGCHRALNLFHAIYDPVLPPGVVNLRCDEHGVHYPRSDVGWFAPEAVHYLYALSTSELSPLQRLSWRRYLTSVPLKRLKALGYPIATTTNVPPNLRALLDYWESSDRGSSKYNIIRSTDAQIHTRHVMDTLLSLLGERTEVVCGAEYELKSSSDRSVMRINGGSHTPDLLVIATGKFIPNQLQQLGKGRLANRFKSISSPIVVLNQELDLPSFIRFTPRVQATVNHIKYQIDGRGVLSTIGSYEYYQAGKEPDLSPFVERVCNRLQVDSSDVLGKYYGTKTEFTGSAERRYNHAVERVNANTYFAIPGKFSQFPLMVNDFSNQLGLRTDIRNDTRGTLSMQVALTAPERIAKLLDRSAGAKTAVTAS